MITIYTDGSSIGNPGPGGWGALIVFGNERVKELGGREDHTTNNKMEIQGAIESLEYVFASDEPAVLFTDSSYLINGITKWIHGWQKNGWITGAKEPVLNKELWEELYAISKKMDITWHHSKGHSGIPGNERVDEIANGLARGEKVTLYEGSLREYGIDLSASAESFKPIYLSMLDGTIERHTSWTACEKRVKGKAGAKFKKVSSAAQEKRILADWEAQ